MSVELKYDQNRKILDVIFSGVTDIDEVTSAFESITNSGDYPPDAKAIWDIRNADSSKVNFKFINELARIRSRFTKRNNCRSALIVASNLQYGLGRMYEMLTEGKIPIQVRIFRDYEEGEKWLLEKH